MKDAPVNKENNGNKYRQIRLLGEGSFGKAYLVECLEDKVNDYFIIICLLILFDNHVYFVQSTAVVKTIYLENMSDDEKKEAYLEAKILEKLDHPNIIKFREVYVTKKPKLVLHIVMDYADGIYNKNKQTIKFNTNKFNIIKLIKIYRRRLTI